MDAFAVERYRFLLAAVAGAVLIAVIGTILLSRRAAPPELADQAAPVQRGAVLPFLMLLVVALGSGTGVILLLPAAMIARYFPGWQVSALLLVAVLFLLAPLVYAWRSRPF